MSLAEYMLIELAKVVAAWAAFETFRDPSGDIGLPSWGGISFCEDHHYGC